MDLVPLAWEDDAGGTTRREMLAGWVDTDITFLYSLPRICGLWLTTGKEGDWTITTYTLHEIYSDTANRATAYKHQ